VLNVLITKNIFYYATRIGGKNFRFFVFIFAKNRFNRQHSKPYLNELCVLRAQETLADIDYRI